MENLEGIRALTTVEKRFIVNSIFNVWITYPQLRLGQLLASCIPENKDLFYIEDYKLIDMMEDRYYKAQGA